MLGKLVRITRESLGVPAGSLGLVTKETQMNSYSAVSFEPGPTIIYDVLMCGGAGVISIGQRKLRYMACDLEEVVLDKESKI